jgi:hypothetical protein
MKTLAKEPAARPASALELSKAFTAAVAGQSGNDKPMDARRRTRIVVQLGEAGAPGARGASHVDEEATMLRPSSRRRSVAQAVFSFVRRAARQTNKRSIAVLILLVAAGLGVIGMKSLTGGADEVSAAIAVAQATVDLAQARIEGLPGDHSLRRRLPQLSRWEAELSGYLTTQERSAETEGRVSAIERAAGRYAEQARRAMEAAPEGINAGERDQEKELDEDEDEEWEKEMETEREKDEREHEKHKRDEERKEKWNPFRKLKKLFD